MASFLSHAQTTDSTGQSPIIIDPSPVFGNDSLAPVVNPIDSNAIDNSNDPIITNFVEADIELKKGEIITNVLQVYNNTDDSVSFSLQVLHPAEWRQLTKSRVYRVGPRDSLFAPVILIPRKLINDNTQLIINAFLLDEDQVQLAANYFTISTKKKVSWEVSTKPTDKIYFKNNETRKDFEVNILNTGNGKQDIFVNQRVLKKNLIITDSSGRFVNESNKTITLNSKEDTTIKYSAEISNHNERNKKRINNNNYLPTKEQEIQKFSLFYSTSEPNAYGNNIYKKSNRIQFVKLPNYLRINNFGYSNLPLIVEANVQNLLGETSFMSLNLRGFKQLNANSSLVYFAQINYTNSYYTNTVFSNSPWYIGYFGPKVSVEAGQISSNMAGINGVGKGFKTSYKFNESNKTSVFWVRSPGFSGPKRTESIGADHEFKLNNNFRIRGAIGLQDNIARNSTINAVSIQPNFNIRQRHYFSLLAASTERESPNISRVQEKNRGYLYGASYSTNFLDKKIRTNMNGRYNDNQFAYGSIDRESFTHRTIYELNPSWNVFLANQYQRSSNFNTITREKLFEQKLFANSLVFSNQVKGGSIQPGIFYDYRNTRFNRLYYRGLSFRYSSFNYKENYLGSFSVRMGYSLPLGMNETSNRDFFTTQINTLIRYRVWNFTARYNYGIFSFSSAENIKKTGITPQDLRLSVQNQYQFKNNHFVLETNAIYNYNNSFDGHTIGVFPEIFYFNNTGWRFSFRANYNFNTRKLRNLPLSDTIAVPILLEPERTYSNNVILGASIRKEFGIPIPFTKKIQTTVDFLAFFDVNGDGIRDNDEPVIENVVIGIQDKEMMTNEEGIATAENIDKGFHSILVFPLADLNGWFANLSDTIAIMQKGTFFIPFTRGVKVYGDVVLDRQDLAVADTNKPFDLSRIKISASNEHRIENTLTNISGRFEFYLPNGQYDITMDERVLGDRYILSKNNIPVTLVESKGAVYISFYIVEKRKKVVRKRFGND